MGIFSRLTDIVNSNLNSILDKAEDPEKIIRMVIQEMEDTLVEVRSSAARSIADQKEVDRNLKRLDQIQADWGAKAELAISKGREDLAKGALVERAKAADMANHLQGEVKGLAEALGRQEEDVIKLDIKLREAKAKRATIEARYKTATNHVRVCHNLYSGKIDDAFERFDKVDARMDRLESVAESYEMGQTQTLADEIQGLEKDESIEQELKALKSKMQKKETKTSKK